MPVQANAIEANVTDQRPHPARRKGCLAVALRDLLLLALLLACFPVVLRWWTDHKYRKVVYVVEEAPARRIAVVFGAGIYPDGRLSPVLADRVDTAVALYRAGKVHKLLMTGDNRFLDYNEPGHMRPMLSNWACPMGTLCSTMPAAAPMIAATEHATFSV